MSVSIIVNGPTCGSELPVNALRLAREHSGCDGVDVRMFLMGDAVGTAVAGQQLPDGYNHLERMVRSVVRNRAEVACCATCMDARAIEDKQLVDSTNRGSMEPLANWWKPTDCMAGCRAVVAAVQPLTSYRGDPRRVSRPAGW